MYKLIIDHLLVIYVIEWWLLCFLFQFYLLLWITPRCKICCRRVSYDRSELFQRGKWAFWGFKLQLLPKVWRHEWHVLAPPPHLLLWCRCWVEAQQPGERSSDFTAATLVSWISSDWFFFLNERNESLCCL